MSAAIEEERESEFALMPTFGLTVRRNHLIEDVLNQLSQFENEDLRKELWVKYNSHLMFLLLRKEKHKKKSNKGFHRKLSSFATEVVYFRVPLIP